METVMDACGQCSHAQEVHNNHGVGRYVGNCLLCVAEKCMKIVNLTQHAGSEEQIRDGLVEPTPEGKKKVGSLLTFEHLPSRKEIVQRAEELAELAFASGCPFAMIGGAPYLMGPLEDALQKKGIFPVYAFSIRESVEETLPDGSVRKSSVFKHGGWIGG